MKAQIVQIGNSQGIRIPKTLLQQTGISGEVELEATPEGILIRNILKPRGNWDAMFREFLDLDDESLKEAEPHTNFEQKEWQW